jgi:hypothetical protein
VQHVAPHDLVITADLPLAAAVVDKHALALNPRALYGSQCARTPGGAQLDAAPALGWARPGRPRPAQRHGSSALRGGSGSGLDGSKQGEPATRPLRPGAALGAMGYGLRHVP